MAAPMMTAQTSIASHSRPVCQEVDAATVSRGGVDSEDFDIADSDTADSDTADSLCKACLTCARPSGRTT